MTSCNKQTSMILTDVLQPNGKLQQAGKIDNLQQIGSRRFAV